MKTNPQFDEFTMFMDKLAKVPNSEVKEKLAQEKREKEIGKKEAAKHES